MGIGLSAIFEKDAGPDAGTKSPWHELGFLAGLGGYIAGDVQTAPAFLLKADYAQTVNIAIAGSSGVGKSLLVNTIRGVQPGDPTWAPVGVTETAGEPMWYEFPADSSIRLWDMEGAGGSCCSWRGYANRAGLRHFDAVLLLCASRLTSSDVEIVQELDRQGVPHFFVRTKVDEDISNCSVDCGMSEEETQESIRHELQSHGIHNPFLINARRPDKFDFPRLIRELVRRLDTSGQGKDSTSDPVDIEASTQQGCSSSSSSSSSSCSSSHAPLEKIKDTVQDPGPPPLFRIPEGKTIAPLEALAAHGGRWTFLEDEGLWELIQDEVGPLAVFAMRRFGYPPEHTYTIRPGGTWRLKIKSSFFPDGCADVVLDPHRKEPIPLTLKMNGKRIDAEGVDYIEGGRLVSQQEGKVLLDKGGEVRPLFARMHRFVVDDIYWQVLENYHEGRYGIRRFKRYPFYRIENETGQQVEMKTLSVGAFLATTNMTASLAPGTNYVDCFARDVREEQVVFTLPDMSKHTICRAIPFDMYCLRTDDFS